MKWRRHGNVATTDCGCYEMRVSIDAQRRQYFNAWHIPSGKHIAAGHKNKDVAAACDAHAAKTTQGQGHSPITHHDASQRMGEV